MKHIQNRLSTSSEHQKYFLENGGIELCIDILKAEISNMFSKLEILQLYAVHILWSFGRNIDACWELVERGAFDVILSVLKSSSSSNLQKASIGALWIMLELIPIQEKAVTDGLAKRLFEFISRSQERSFAVGLLSSSDSRELILGTLYTLTTNSELFPQLVNEGIYTTLLLDLESSVSTSILGRYYISLIWSNILNHSLTHSLFPSSLDKLTITRQSKLSLTLILLMTSTS